MLRPESSLVVLAGDAEKVRSDLEAADLGPVEVIQPTDAGVED
jgi:hypothetical protein